MKVIYCVSELLDWIDVAKHFEQTKNWEPALWITTNKNQSYLKKQFPHIDTIDFNNANRGIVENIVLQKDIILCEDIILKYLKYEKIALKMMDRMDPLGYDFNYSERTQLYYIVLEFVINYMTKNKIELIFFNESAHSIFTYLIYAVAVENNIKILRLSPTHIYANTFLTSSLEKVQPYLEDVYKNTVENRYIGEEVNRYFDTVNGRYENATPYYMSKIISLNNQSSVVKILKSSLKAMEYFIRLKPRGSYHKKNKYSIRKTFTNKNYANSIIKSTLYKIKLQKEYMKYVQKSLNNFDLDEKFIYFPLQYQPEKSTSPEGNIFVDQFLAINMLSKVSKGKFKIYIKEHISQFSTKLKGEQGRVISFYEELSLLENVVFIDTSVSSFLLIDNAMAVSTITGTAAFESVIRGKPSLIFGYPWYKECEGVFQVNNIKKLEEAINIINRGYKVNVEYVKYFLQSIFTISEKIYLNPSNSSSIKNENHSNTESIIKLIEKYESKVI